MKIFLITFTLLFALHTAAHATWHEDSIQIGDKKRWYRIYTPIQPEKNAAAILILHGGTQSMRSMFEKRAGGSLAWLEIAERENLILIVPNGSNAKTGDTFGDNQNWNDLREDGPITTGHKDDLYFIEQLLKSTQDQYHYNPSRLYITGASNGGMMTYNLLLHLPTRFAAAAAFVANLPAKSSKLKPPAHLTPIMIMNGTDDPLMKWDGGMIGKYRGVVASAHETLNWWLGTNHVDKVQAIHNELPIQNNKDKCRITSDYYHANQTNAADVLFYTMQNGGHMMPSIKYPVDFLFSERILGPNCKQAEGAELSWDFFRTRGENH